VQDERGDDFVQFALENRASLRLAAYRLCGDWHEAEDLVQVTLLKLYRLDAASQGKLSIAYAHRTLQSVVIDERRRRRWSCEVSVAEVPEANIEDPQIADRIVMTHAIQQLDTYERAIVLLRFWADLSVEQAAAVLSSSPYEVIGGTRRALRTIRGILGPT
jgi:RNA polymerase sigma factor (sigma-70 family)